LKRGNGISLPGIFSENTRTAVERLCPVKGKTKEHWAALCEQAAVEQDSERLVKLINEIHQMLDEKEHRRKRERPHQNPDVSLNL